MFTKVSLLRKDYQYMYSVYIIHNVVLHVFDIWFLVEATHVHICMHVHCTVALD